MTTAIPRRFRLSFSLRLLLGLALAVCIFCAGWAANEWKHRRALEQQEQAIFGPWERVVIDELTGEQIPLEDWKQTSPRKPAPLDQ